MLFAFLLLCIFILISVLLLILLLTGVISPTQSGSNAEIVAALQALQNAKGWSTPQPANELNAQGQQLGICSVYETFVQDVSTVSSLPSTPIADIPQPFLCLDPYSQALQLFTHTCGYADGCVGYDGLEYTYGQSEVFFQPCGNLPPCTYVRSSVIFNFQTQNGLIEPGAVCLNYPALNQDYIGSYDVVGCTSISPPLSILSNVDTSPDPSGAQLVRIRAPGTYNCLASDLSLPLCEDMPNTGYAWFLNPPVSLSAVPGQEEDILPAVISTLPAGGIPTNVTFAPQTPEDYTNLLDFVNTLESLTYTPEGFPQTQPFPVCVTEAPCPDTTIILPAQQWAIVGSTT